MKYLPPNVGDNKVVYKGKRYWVIELNGKKEIDGFSSNFCQFIMYDKLFQSVIATISKDDSGILSASLMSHVELIYDFKTMDDLVSSVPYLFHSYMKDCYG